MRSWPAWVGFALACKLVDRASTERSAADGTVSSAASALPRVSRQLSQKNKQSSGVSSPLYRPHVQCIHEWHSSHCTQLSTYSGRSFSFFSIKRSIYRTARDIQSFSWKRGIRHQCGIHGMAMLRPASCCDAPDR